MSNGRRLTSVASLPWEKYPRRTCQSLHHCEVCDKDITLGQVYLDGGYSRRAHVDCLPNLEAKAEKAIG